MRSERNVERGRQNSFYRVELVSSLQRSQTKFPPAKIRSKASSEQGDLSRPEQPMLRLRGDGIMKGAPLLSTHGGLSNDENDPFNSGCSLLA